MSHLTHIKNVFTRLDLLRQALSKFQFTVVENEHIRFYGHATTMADIVAKLHDYDLGFVKKTADGVLLMDDTETEMPESKFAYTPVFDSWNGEVERVFGNNLCLLNAEYYSLLLSDTQEERHTVSVTETENEIVVTLEI